MKICIFFGQIDKNIYMIWTIIFIISAKKLAELLFINLHPDMQANMLDPELVKCICEGINPILYLLLLIFYICLSILDDKLDFITVTIHIFNFFLMMIDFILVAHPFRLLHIFWSMLLAVVYELFSWIYFLFGGTGR